MKKISFSLLSLLLLAGMVLFCACGNQNDRDPDPVSPHEPDPAANSVMLTLYFSDDQANFVKPEQRQVELTSPDDEVALATAIMNELIAGPTQAGLYRTLPENVVVNHIEIDDGLAIVDLSSEVQASHGSAGEYIALFSITNSLTELDFIDAVKILIDGEAVDTLSGHFDLRDPLTRNEDAIAR